MNTLKKIFIIALIFPLILLVVFFEVFSETTEGLAMWISKLTGSFAEFLKKRLQYHEI